MGLHCAFPNLHVSNLHKIWCVDETSAESDGIVGHWLVSPHTVRYLVPGLSFEGTIFKEQQTTFV